MSTPQKPTTAPDPRAAEIAEVLVGIGLQTPLGQSVWRAWLIGYGQPKGDGSLTVTAAAYAPKPAAPGTPAPGTG